MIHPLTFLKGAGLGAGMMYFFDPTAGERRRTAIRDQIADACTLCNQASDQLQNVAAEVRDKAQASDQPLMERVQEGLTDLGHSLAAPKTWSPNMKTAAMIGGAGLVASLLSKRDVAALALGVVGLSLVAKQVANEEQQSSSQHATKRGGSSQGKTASSRIEKSTKNEPAHNS
jgi:hypothetical protein